MVVVGSRDIHIIATLKGDGEITIVASVTRTDDGILINVIDDDIPLSSIDATRLSHLIQILTDCEY